MTKGEESLERMGKNIYPTSGMYENDDIEKDVAAIKNELKEGAFLKEALRMFIKINDDDISHLKIKVIPQNVAVNQDIIKLIKDMMK